MATPLRMPDLGTVEGDVLLVRWLKAEGQTIALGEPLFEAETDKGVSTVEAALAGVLVKRVVSEGSKAGAGETIALIRRPGEPDEEMPGERGVSDGPAPARVLRALAAKRGVDLASLERTGAGGRMTREDVLRARRAPTTLRTSVAAPQLSHAQAIVARKVTQSHREKPVYRVNAKANMSRATELREQSRKAGAAAISWDAIFVKAAAMAVAEMPVFRLFMQGEAVAEHVPADIAVAVGIGDDLYIPSVRAPAGKSVAAVSAEIAALSKKADTRSLVAADVEGSCFLVSNLGMFPIDSFDAIIYPDHSAALAVGAVTHTPVSDGTRIRSAPVARLSLAVDHRLINGRTAARFMTRLKQILETGAFA
jgi:pyruvate dehydrogenase E2 component (dihydrolipoamide acetyltransferase)